MCAGLIRDEGGWGFAIDVGEVWEELERVIEGSEQRLEETKRRKEDQWQASSLVWRAQIHSVSFPRTASVRLLGLSHQRERRMKRQDERTRWSMVDV